MADETIEAVNEGTDFASVNDKLDIIFPLVRPSAIVAITNLSLNVPNIRLSRATGGIGAVFLSNSGSFVTIEKVYTGMEAEGAGLQSGDVILSVDGIDVHDSDQASSLLRGEVGSDVTVTVLRGTQSFDTTITREVLSMTDDCCYGIGINPKSDHVQLVSEALQPGQYCFLEGYVYCFRVSND